MSSETRSEERQHEAQDADPATRLRQAGLRPTQQRLALANLLFDGGGRHFTADDLYTWARNADVKVSLATVYNTLNQFSASGLVREVMIAGGKSYFDTNVSAHHHFYLESTGELIDIPPDLIEIARLPEIPDAMEVDRVEVVIKLRDTKEN